MKRLQEGDRNAKFFNMTTLIQRRRNKIERLKDDREIRVEDANGIKALVVQFFSSLFSHNFAGLDDMAFPNLFFEFNVDLYSLGKNVEFSEVKDSLFNIGGLPLEWMVSLPVFIKTNGKPVLMIAGF
ncbi:hypothetical protein L3X38_025908 [Prunus dulcis]|uniref:Uncharacterized protein n=1 Tax=Prunus dulcis TaxID=3755 RepID=A0AAD4W2M4_PRUDU|nr:hypothetical protein L3X38_025908 [Prunus dulcis]